jgi:antitoxin (DNA-binding transcriptional repressor) of toxin-antitoxin stability system
MAGGEEMTTIDVNEAQSLAQLVDLAKAGNEVILAEGSTPVARVVAIVPPSSQPQPRVAGLHSGAALVSDDFDHPLPDEFWMGNA